jgi:Tol biopolymer transport system component
MRRPTSQARYRPPWRGALPLVLATLLLGACRAADAGSASPQPSLVSPAASEAPATSAPSAPSATATAEPTPVDAGVAAGLAFVRPADGLVQLFVFDPDGTERQVSGLAAEHASIGAVQPIWSPDRSMIAFGPPSIGSGLDPQVWVVNADGTNQRPIATLGEWTEWSPDSTRLVWTDSVFTTDNTGEYARMWIGNVASGEVRQLGPRGTVTHWLPDGEHISYVPAEEPESGIFVIPVDGGEPVELTTGVGPWWSPDGSSLLVERGNATYLVSADGAQDRLLIDGAGSPAWSPDGTRVAFGDVDDAGTFVVGVVDLDGNVLWSEVPGTDPAWSPDGANLAVEVFDPDGPYIAILDAASGEVVWELEGRFPDW